MLILVSMIYGGGGSQQSAAPAKTAAVGVFKAPDNDNVNGAVLINTVPLVFGISQSPVVQDYETNKLTRVIEKSVNVDLSFEYYPSNEAAAKVRILIFSGSKLPDVITGFNIDDLDLLEYGSQGAIIPLNNYVDTYGTYCRDMYNEKPLYKQCMTSPDGNIYAMPNVYEQTRNEWGCLAWINQNWLDKVNKPIPKTTADFYDVLKAFRDGDPNGNGKKDIIPFIGSVDSLCYDFIINAFTYFPPNSAKRIQVKDGKLNPAYTTNEWRDALIYMNMLCKEDLFSPLTFTQNNATYQAMLRNKDYALVGVATGTANNLAANADRLLEYTDLPPLVGPKGVKWSTWTPSFLPTNQYVITKDCKTPAAAYLVADFMMSPEIGYYNRFGEPGVDWVKPEPGAKGYLSDLGYPATVVPILVWGSNQNSHWQQGGPGYGTYENGNGQVWDGNPANGPYYNHKAVYTRIGLRPDEVVYKFIYNNKEADEMKDLDITINNYVKESTARFITGDLDINGKAWDTYLAELKNMGLDRYMQINQAAYDRMQLQFK